MEHLINRFLKTVFVVSMLMINIIFISIPSIRKYFEYGIVIEVSSVTLNDLPSPAFTISRIGSDGQ